MTWVVDMSTNQKVCFSFTCQWQVAMHNAHGRGSMSWVGAFVESKRVCHSTVVTHLPRGHDLTVFAFVYLYLCICICFVYLYLLCVFVYNLSNQNVSATFATHLPRGHYHLQKLV